MAGILGGVAGLVGLFALVVLLNQGLSLVGCTAATPLGWTIPLVSLVVIGVAAWVLISQPEKDSGKTQEFASTVCHACGRNVMAEWRLCPYCGSSAPAAEPEQDPAGTVG
jgi:hypothetical protein